MARARQKPSGRREIGLRHPSLPGGRKYFTFHTEAEAKAYAEQWASSREEVARLIAAAGIGIRVFSAMTSMSFRRSAWIPTNLQNGVHFGG
jgi:hypothetical protein